MNLENEIEEVSVESVMLHYRIIKNASRGNVAHSHEELPTTFASTNAENAWITVRWGCLFMFGYVALPKFEDRSQHPLKVHKYYSDQPQGLEMDI